MCTFYILYSKNTDKYYVGATCDDMSERLRRHNAKHKKGFTGKSSDWKIAYCEHFENKEQAFNREKEVKKWKSRIRIEKLIEEKTM
ncbi:Excinuclease ABC C subunit domain protein (fragment) [uncultured Paludibacter sp.]|uniref:Excinuclease ABC C subunit domain protein n=1 Tax=uncultured Paludibacter sp. TaxID=497635 RepID=A0A653AGZ6_9BACT